MSTLFIRADATTEIGTGHLMRCLALGQAWQDDGGHVVFISHCESESLQKRLEGEGFELILIDKTHPDSLDIGVSLSAMRRFAADQTMSDTWIVVDGYHFDVTYQRSIKNAGYKLLFMDDYCHCDHYLADIVVNHNLTADKSL